MRVLVVNAHAPKSQSGRAVFAEFEACVRDALSGLVDSHLSIDVQSCS